MQTADCRHLAGMVLPSRVEGWELSYHCINSLDTLEAIAPPRPSVAHLCLWNGKQISGWPRERLTSEVCGVRVLLAICFSLTPVGCVGCASQTMEQCAQAQPCRATCRLREALLQCAAGPGAGELVPRVWGWLPFLFFLERWFSAVFPRLLIIPLSIIYIQCSKPGVT